jgi:hypothetical protein
MFDAHPRAFAFFGWVPLRGIYGGVRHNKIETLPLPHPSCEARE